MNAEQFWAVPQAVHGPARGEYEGVDQPAPADPAAVAAQAEANLRIAMSVLRRDDDLVDWLSDRLAAIAASVPDDIDGFRLDEHSAEAFSDRRIFDVASYPQSMWRKPGDKAPNRAGLAAWGAYVNSLALRDYGRPLFIAASADLAESTNIAGFGQDYDGSPGTGWYERTHNPTGALLPTEITEFSNAGLVAGLATVNLSDDPFGRVQRVLGRVLHLRLVLLPQVRAAAAVQPARPGHRAQGGQGAVDRGPLRPGDRRGLPHPLRHLLHRRHPAVPVRARHRPAPVGVQRGPGAARRGVRRSTCPSWRCT